MFFSRSVVLVGALASSLLAGCGSREAGMKLPEGVSRQSFGKLPDGSKVDLYTLRNSAGAEVKITNYGGIVTSLMVPDKQGVQADVVLGYDHLEDYLRVSPYFGALIGRYGNRIGAGTFQLDGKTCTLAKNNNGLNFLHGGEKGFDKVLWSAKALRSADGPALELSYLSKDGEEGFPGALSVQARYTWTDDFTLRLEFTATTDKPTVVNLTHHSYFNLAGAGKGDILGHVLTIPADGFTPIDKGLIPTGRIQAVKGTPFDFNLPTAIGKRIQAKDEQLAFGLGYDHNWVLKKQAGEMPLVARVKEPNTGRVLEVRSAEPGIQFYSGNFLDGSIHGKGGLVYAYRSGFCLEPQHFPDSPNKPQFPSTRLDPGQTYHHTLSYHFSAE